MTHGTAYAYKKLGCRCPDCRAAANAQNRRRLADPAARERRRQRDNARNHERRKREPYTPRLSKPLAELIRADRLLRDGASYAETARSVGWDEKTVARHFPRYGWDRQQVARWAGTADVRRAKLGSYT